MMQDTVMAVAAIPLAHDGKTYYGCCKMCKAKIATEPARYTLARDPVSGVSVDKATAVLLSVDGRVHYFESEDTRKRFMGRLTGNP
jgi:YHS domain-containing protein